MPRPLAAGAAGCHIVGVDNAGHSEGDEAPRRWSFASIRLAVLAAAFLVVLVVRNMGDGPPRCVAGSGVDQEQIAAVPVDPDMDYSGRDPRHACITAIPTPASEEIARVLILRDPDRCSDDYCRTEIWFDRRVGVLTPAIPASLRTRPYPTIEEQGDVPILTFAALSGAEEQSVRLIYSRSGSNYVPIDTGTTIDPPDLQPMRFAVAQIDGRPALFGQGDITADTIYYFEKAARDAQLPRGSKLYLDSPGGDADGAMAFARSVRRLGLATDVARLDEQASGPALTRAECVSACAFVFLGGAERALFADSVLAYHGPLASPGALTGHADTEGEQPLSNDPDGFRDYGDRLRAFVQELGFGAPLAERILTVRADQVCAPSRAELIHAQVLPGIDDSQGVFGDMDCLPIPRSPGPGDESP